MGSGSYKINEFSQFHSEIALLEPKNTYVDKSWPSDQQSAHVVEGLAKPILDGTSIRWMALLKPSEDPSDRRRVPKATDWLFSNDGDSQTDGLPPSSHRHLTAETIPRAHEIMVGFSNPT